MNYRSIARNVLMSGASLAAMVMGSSLRAHAAGTTINTPVASVSVTTAQSFDYVLIDTTTVSGNVTNSGTIGLPSIDEQGLAILDSTIGGAIINSSGAEIAASEIGIHVGRTPVTGGIVNHGGITVNAPSLLTSQDLIVGIAVSGTAVATGIVNDGDISVTANGTGFQGNIPDTYLPVAGIGIVGHSAVAANIDNSGRISVTASRTGSTSAAASAAGIYVFNVDPSSVEWGGVSITNSGELSITASADAPDADARATGIMVNASAFGDALELDLANNYDGVVSVLAMATGAGKADAIVRGIAQRGSGVHDLTIDLVNDGTIDIIASAEASSAYAYVSDAVRQSASATGDAGDTATVTLTNTSSLTLDIQANAIAKSDNARAIASMGHYPSSSLDDYEFVIGQQVSDADNAVITLDNSGTINLVANAMAEGASGAAGTQAAAQAGLYLAILQGASFDGSNHEDDPDVSNQTALLTLTNSGLINIKAVANANGNEAEAEATLHEGITQAAYEAAETSAILNNSGTLNILVEAVAKGTDYAIAKASNDDALSQYAAGNGDEGDIASVTLNNSGSLALINIRADATATANSAEAFATVDSGIEQYAEDVDEARVVLSNSGTLNVQAHAVAKGTDKAKAYVSVTDAIYQTASGNGNEGDIASVTLNNSGSLAVINIRADATATAKSAIATAIFETGIEQDASNADEATVLLNNSGTFNIIGNAIAHGVSQASASVDASYGGIWQEATAIEGGSFASASVNNSGTLSLQAQASATAETGAANATVTYEEAAFYQSATDGLVSTVSLANSGTLNIIGKAIAHGVSKATANAAHSQEEDEYASIWQAATAAEGGSLASVTINNSGTLSLQALATATAETGAAEASASYIYAAFHQSAGDGAINTVSLINSGNFDITRNAHAEGATAAYASAENAEEALFSQQAGSDSDDVAKASAEIINSGDFLIESTAFAKAASGDATATVSYYYTQVLQKADDADEVVALLDNSGEFAILAHAQATGDNAKATATADEPAFEQNVDTDGEDILAHAIVTNSGTFLISSDAIAKAHTGGKATAKAFIETGINQLADDADDTLASLTNDGLMSISVDASALVAGSSGTANASASMTSAIYQDADAEGRAAGEVKLVNTASLNITADAKAVAGDVANASAVLGSKTDEDAEYGPIIQYAKDGATVLVSINNSGELQISANADAEAFDASALARATSIKQYVVAAEADDEEDTRSATASFTNSGSVAISAEADALGRHGEAITTSAKASAVAYANGLYQALDIQTDDTSDALVREFTAQFDNSGELLIVAEASATASAGTDANTSAALAEAIGYIGHTDTSGDTLDMDFTNSGFFVVSAMANVGGSGSVNAQAVGVRYESDILTGTFLNSEVLGAVAYASSDDDGGTARAVGLDIITNDAGDASFVNTGMLAALAYGSDAQATAVSFADNNAFDTGDAAATFSNHGGYVYALISDEGGSASGTAFNTGGASYQVMLDLQGNGGEDGLIEGDIVFKAGDQIEATQGRTYFYGTINPSEENLGELSVLDDGEFVLGNDETLGPTVSHVDQLTVHGDGTLGFEIDTDPDVSRIAATDAALDGTILVLARAGLYAETQTYQDVIDADELTGTFAVEMSNSPLLNLSVAYDDDDNVDLVVTRNEFQTAEGLTPNQKSVAASLESTYGDIDPDDEYGSLVQELFTLDAEELGNALDDVSGVEYSNTLQWALGSFNLFQDAVKYRINSAGNEGISTSNYGQDGAAGHALPQANASGWWARIQGAIGDQDDDGNASGYSYDEALALIGVDAVIDETFMIGAAGGFFAPGNLDFDNGNQVVQDIGYQVGGYAQYDSGTAYLRGFAGYGAWDASATRTLSIGGLSGVNNSDFDVSVWEVSGEAGYDLELDNATLTPFIGVSYTKASIGSYVETGFAASALAGNGGKGEALDGIAGMRLSGLSYKSGGMTIKPEGAVGYIHNFSDAVSLNNTLIAAPSGTSGFDTLGVDNNGGVFLDLGATVYYDQNVTFGFGYAGEYGTNHSEHSGFGKFNMNF